MDNKMEHKPIRYNYIIISLIMLVVIIINWVFTHVGTNWYNTLNVPSFMPSSKTISVFWWLMYIPTTISVLLVWNTFERTFRSWVIIIFFAINVILNVIWHYLFFYQHLLGMASLEAVSLTFSVLVLILLIQPISLSTALLLYPYLLWTSFVTYLNYMTWLIN